MNVLSYQRKEQFEQEGYLVVEDFLDPATELPPVLAEFEGVLDRLATRLLKQGQIRSTAGFIARSRSHPESVLSDPDEWTRRWESVRSALIGEDRKFSRWAKVLTAVRDRANAFGFL